MSLYSFTEREPGYSYRVKARMVVPDVAPQDGPSYHLEFIEVLSREKYEGNESFEISLIQSFLTGGPAISLSHKHGEYHFFPEQITLPYPAPELGRQMDERSEVRRRG